MDKYQSSLINRGIFSLLAEQGNGTVALTDDALVLTQNENYAIMQYTLRIENPMIASAMVGDKVYARAENAIEIVIDFATVAESIEIVFENDFADPCKLALQYVFADKKNYDDKVAAVQQEQYLATMRFTHRVGYNLVNLFWQNACESVKETEIAFYAFIEGKRGLKDIRVPISKNAYTNEQFYCAIPNLAIGNYIAVITQKDSAGKVLITKEKTIILNTSLTIS